MRKRAMCQFLVMVQVFVFSYNDAGIKSHDWILSFFLVLVGHLVLYCGSCLHKVVTNWHITKYFISIMWLLVSVGSGNFSLLFNYIIIFSAVIWSVFCMVTGGKPYPGLPRNEVAELLVQGHTMELPYACSEEM